MRLYILIIICIFSVTGHLRAEEFAELFGLKLLDQVQSHFSLKMIDNEKYKNAETIIAF